MPSTNELSVNGLHHGAFRHEKGNNQLNAEKGTQLDIDYTYKSSRWNIFINPFISYFDNFIFLNPTGEWSLLPHAGQIYTYEQSKALLTGGEIEVNYSRTEKWNFTSQADVVYSKNITDNYPLPFTPPARWTTSAEYILNLNKILSMLSVKIAYQHIFPQNRIARNEKKLPEQI